MKNYIELKGLPWRYDIAFVDTEGQIGYKTLCKNNIPFRCKTYAHSELSGKIQVCSCRKKYASDFIEVIKGIEKELSDGRQKEYEETVKRFMKLMEQEE